MQKTTSREGEYKPLTGKKVFFKAIPNKVLLSKTHTQKKPKKTLKGKQQKKNPNWLESGPKTLADTSLKKIYRWKINT